MHVTPQKVDVESCDRFGIVQVAPAGDKERAAEGRQWEQRLEVMTASMVYLRNSPSILFWEAGNNGIPAAQMKQMVELEKQWDPHGGRAMGCRTLNDPADDADRRILWRDDRTGRPDGRAEDADGRCSGPTARNGGTAPR